MSDFKVISLAKGEALTLDATLKPRLVGWSVHTKDHHVYFSTEFAVNDDMVVFSDHMRVESEECHGGCSGGTEPTYVDEATIL